jgi:hypothetical protein
LARMSHLDLKQIQEPILFKDNSKNKKNENYKYSVILSKDAKFLYFLSQKKIQKYCTKLEKVVFSLAYDLNDYVKNYEEMYFGDFGDMDEEKEVDFFGSLFDDRFRVNRQRNKILMMFSSQIAEEHLEYFMVQFSLLEHKVQMDHLDFQDNIDELQQFCLEYAQRFNDDEEEEVKEPKVSFFYSKIYDSKIPLEFVYDKTHCFLKEYHPDKGKIRLVHYKRYNPKIPSEMFKSHWFEVSANDQINSKNLNNQVFWLNLFYSVDLQIRLEFLIRRTKKVLFRVCITPKEVLGLKLGLLIGKSLSSESSTNIIADFDGRLINVLLSDTQKEGINFTEDDAIFLSFDLYKRTLASKNIKQRGVSLIKTANEDEVSYLQSIDSKLVTREMTDKDSKRFILSSEQNRSIFFEPYHWTENRAGCYYLYQKHSKCFTNYLKLVKIGSESQPICEVFSTIPKFEHSILSSKSKFTKFMTITQNFKKKTFEGLIVLNMASNRTELGIVTVDYKNPTFPKQIKVLPPLNMDLSKTIRMVKVLNFSENFLMLYHKAGNMMTINDMKMKENYEFNLNFGPSLYNDQVALKDVGYLYLDEVKRIVYFGIVLRQKSEDQNSKEKPIWYYSVVEFSLVDRSVIYHGHRLRKASRMKIVNFYVNLSENCVSSFDLFYILDDSRWSAKSSENFELKKNSNNQKDLEESKNMIKSANSFNLANFQTQSNLSEQEKRTPKKSFELLRIDLNKSTTRLIFQNTFQIDYKNELFSTKQKSKPNIHLYSTPNSQNIHCFKNPIDPTELIIFNGKTESQKSFNLQILESYHLLGSFSNKEGTTKVIFGAKCGLDNYKEDFLQPPKNKDSNEIKFLICEFDEDNPLKTKGPKRFVDLKGQNIR